MFQKVLIANRGEIARRITRTLKKKGIASVAVFSDSDRDSPHVLEADEAVHLGQDPAVNSYLDVEKVIAAAVSSGADAIHPGYGFLSENVALKRAAHEAGIVFIGPNELALEVMGDKARSREMVQKNGVPVVPGFDASHMSDEETLSSARQIELPILLKPSAGGGGKGMEVVNDFDELPAKLASAKRVALAAFGDAAIVVEKLIARPRHIEVQIFADSAGKIITLGERECTLQRRHQKVIEEAPSLAITEQTRQRLFEAAKGAARSVDYLGAGTVEFLIDADNPDEFFFIEMNTRLQVEHPVTEEVTGVDLVELQLLVAAGGDLPDEPSIKGHAIEARVYAEDPASDFLPSVGDVAWLRFGEGVRVDSAVETGSQVSQFYDPMIAKVISYGVDREEALARLDRALKDTEILGVKTNIGFLRTLLADTRVKKAELETGLIDQMLPLDYEEPEEAVLQAAARELLRGSSQELKVGEPWGSLKGWRVSGESAGAETLTLKEVGTSHTFDVQTGSDVLTAKAALSGGAAWATKNGHTHAFTLVTRRAKTLAALTESGAPGEGSPECLAQMPGAVTLLHVEDGALVAAGDPIISVEAMKMEHPVRAARSGTVKILTTLGAQVRQGEVVAVIEEE